MGTTDGELGTVTNSGAARPSVWRVVCVEDDADLLVLLRVACEHEPDFELVASTGDAAEALRLCADLTPDVVILDHHLTNQTDRSTGADGPLAGARLVARVRLLLPAATVAVFSGMTGVYEEVSTAGADVHIEKPHLAALWPAIRKSLEQNHSAPSH